ncbi:MAG: NAD(+)/NADH kinase [Lachnospiraceae bacterium]|nr:NAD(+)/NADH kinase [Lachnospiraceae bacterium]
MPKAILVTNTSKHDSGSYRKLAKDILARNNFDCLEYDAFPPLEEHGGSIVKMENGFLIDGEILSFEIAKDIKFILVLGGDGTVICAARKFLEMSLPVFGVNIGNIGFLTQCESNDMEKAIEKLCKGEFLTEERMLINCTFNGKDIGEAINDIYIIRNGFSQIVEARVWVNKEEAFSFAGDGVVVSTPTGSTGYNLSAGGAIVKPDARIMQITPMCPHSLKCRSILVSDEDEITLAVGRKHKVNPKDVVLVVDGQEAVFIDSDDLIVLRKSDKKALFAKLSDYSFFNVLTQKL